MRQIKRFNPKTGKLTDDMSIDGPGVVCSPSDDQLSAANATIQADYQSDVDGIVMDVFNAIKDGETDRESAHERIWEAVDGSARVIYTYQARLGMCATDNPDAWEDMGMDKPTVEQMMFAAMVADVTEELERWLAYLPESDESEVA